MQTVDYYNPANIPGLPDDAEPFHGPPAPCHDGWIYTFHSDKFPGIWSVVVHEGQDPHVQYQPTLWT